MQIVGNRKYLWALLAFLMIPVIVVGGGALVVAIDPEKLAGHTHYVRNFRILQLVKSGLMLAMLGSVVVGWLVACALVIRAKNREYQWLLLALLGPIGLAILASLRTLGSESSEIYERFIRRLNRFVRIVYEAGFFLLGWNLAWEMMILKREAMIFSQSVMTGLSREQILDQQNASSGMWAFSEFMEVMYFFVLLYLLRPVVVNAVGAMFKVADDSGLGGSRTRNRERA